MIESNHDRFSRQVRELPGQLVLALTNATALLVVVAAILALVAIARIENFVGNVVATMTGAVLSKVDLPSKDVLSNIRELTRKTQTLSHTLREIKVEESPALQSEIAQLKDSLIFLSINVDRLRSSRSILTNELAARFGDSIVNTLVKLRNCSANPGANGAPSG